MEHHSCYEAEWPYDLSAHHELDYDEINQIMNEIETNESQFSKDNPQATIGLPSSLGISAQYSIISQTIHDDLDMSSLMTTSLSDFNFATNLTTSVDSEPELSKSCDWVSEQAELALDIPLEWSLPALEQMTTHMQLEPISALQDSTWSWDEYLPYNHSSNHQNPSNIPATTPTGLEASTPEFLSTSQCSSSSSPSSFSTASPSPTNNLTCAHCAATFTDKTKLKIHTNKHTKPFRCTATGCDYATAEKKTLERHVIAKARWDGHHQAAADAAGVREMRRRCPNAVRGCTYVTSRKDNLGRHISTCTSI